MPVDPRVMWPTSEGRMYDQIGDLERRIRQAETPRGRAPQLVYSEYLPEKLLTDTNWWLGGPNVELYAPEHTVSLIFFTLEGRTTVAADDIQIGLAEPNDLPTCKTAGTGNLVTTGWLWIASSLEINILGLPSSDDGSPPMGGTPLFVPVSPGAKTFFLGIKADTANTATVRNLRLWAYIL